MASVVPSASCYDRRAPRPMHLMGRPGGETPSPFGSCGHRSGGRPRLVTHTPKMTLKQICQLLRAMRQVPPQESGSALAARDEASFLPNPDSPVPGATEH